MLQFKLCQIFFRVYHVVEKDFCRTTTDNKNRIILKTVLGIIYTKFLKGIFSKIFLLIERSNNLKKDFQSKDKKIR